MRRPPALALRALVIAAIACAPITTRAEVPLVGRFFAGGGQLSSDVLADDFGRPPTRYEGWAFLAGGELYMPALMTRFGAAYGPHWKFEVGVFSPGVWKRSDEPSLLAAPALLFMDVENELGVAVTPLYRERVDLVVKLDGVLGIARRGVAAGVDLSVKVGKVRLELAPQLRTGTSWRGHVWREQRTRAGVRIGDAHVWLEVIKGFNEDEMGRADLGAFQRGGYLQAALLLGWEAR